MKFIRNEDVVDPHRLEVDVQQMAYKGAKITWEKLTDLSEQALNSVDERPPLDAAEHGHQQQQQANRTEGFHMSQLDVVFEAGTLTLVTGPIASGKSSFLLGLLEEMRLQQGQIHLPRNQGISYVPQISWLQNATIKNNILFGSSLPFDAVRYRDAIRCCGLEPDLAIFSAGDETEIGERGYDLYGHFVKDMH